jgi:probable HAF family extracellular repeat protein
MFHRSTVIFGILLLAVSAAGLAPAGPYYVTDLGVLASGTGTTSYAMAVNDSGVVAGASCTTTAANSWTAAIYTGGAWANIGNGISTNKTMANGVTDSGLVSCFKGLEGDSYIYNANTSQYTNIGTQPGVCNGLDNHCGQDTFFGEDALETGTPMNSSGEIVGAYWPTSGPAPGSPDLFVYAGGSTSTVTTPQTGQGGNITCASGINNNGVVVGNYQLGVNPIPTGFYYQNSTLYTISNMACPEAINGNEVVGADNDGVAAIYTLGANSATSIGTLGGYQSIAYAVSSAGTVVGYSYETSGAQAALVYSNGTMTDLNTQIIGPNPFSELSVAYGISPNGEYIVGDATVGSGPFEGDTQGFLLTAAIPGDANGDGTVDINDLTIVLAHYNQTGQTWADGEFTGDGTVDINDLTIVLAHYGDTVGSSAAGNPSAVPEPAGLVLLVCGGLAALAAALRRRN